MRMRKKNDMIRYSFAAVLALLLASCVKDELYNTPHPDKGVISVSVDVPQGAEEDDYTVEVDGQPLDEGDNASNPLTPGEHTVLVYNTPEGFTVTDGIAYVERVDGTRALTDLIDPLRHPATDARPPLGTDRNRGRSGTHCLHYGHTLRRGGGLRPAQ